MEKTIDTVLRSIGNPSLASGMISRSPSPAELSTQNTTHALLAHSSSPSPSPSTSAFPHPSSPKLHSLPDNALNPLGLLAEASLANRRAHATQPNPPSIATAQNGLSLGVASDNYFKPGPMTILPLRRLYIERQVQPEMLSFVSTDEVVALFDMSVLSSLSSPLFSTLFFFFSAFSVISTYSYSYHDRNLSLIHPIDALQSLP